MAAKRKKTKRRSPKKKVDRSDEPDEAEATDEDGEAVAAGADDDVAVDAGFDEDDGDEDEDEAAADAPPDLAGRPVGPALDPGSPDARVSTSGGLWVMGAVFGLIAAAVAVQFLLG